MAVILIMDDKPDVRNRFAEELALEGHTVFSLGNPVSINQVILCSQPDLIIVDPFLGGNHRWDLLTEIKQRNPHLPIIILTSFDSYRQEPHLRLATALLIKSFCFDDLKNKIGEILGKKDGKMRNPTQDRRA